MCERDVEDNRRSLEIQPYVSFCDLASEIRVYNDKNCYIYRSEAL
jgi:hypothetical protein